MRIVPCLTLLLLVFSVSAQAPEPAPLAHGSVPGEPHHPLRIENEYVRVYYVEVHLALRDSETHFTRGGFAHVARNLADTPFRNVTIELLHAQGEAHNECGFVIPGQGGAICDPPFASEWADTQFETTEVRLDLLWLFANGKHTESTSKLAFLAVRLGGPQVRINAKGKLPKTLRKGEVEWFDPGSEVQFSHEGTEVAQFLELTFKDSALRRRP